MISLYKIEEKKVSPDENYQMSEDRISVELRGLSTDEKPTEIGSKKIDNGSSYIEVDTGNVYIYDLENEEWNEV